MLELEPGSSFSTAALATLRQKLLEMPELVLRLDCSYTQVDDELAADLIGAEALSALRRWQPSVTPAVAVAWPEVGELPTLHPAVAPAAATATTAATAPKVVEVEALKPKTLPDVKVKEALSSPSRRPSATSPMPHVANESAGRLASNSRPASSSPLFLRKHSCCFKHGPQVGGRYGVALEEAVKAEMRGQQGAAGEVIELLAQKSGSHPMGVDQILKAAENTEEKTKKQIHKGKQHKLPVWEESDSSSSD
eukprot:symbB.v1.2.035757.t2/scaffold4893.1/size33339/1